MLLSQGQGCTAESAAAVPVSQLHPTGSRGQQTRGLQLLTECQYSATCLRPTVSQMYTRLRMSFWKQLPPKPTEALRNLRPMRESVPMEWPTCTHIRASMSGSLRHSEEQLRSVAGARMHARNMQAPATAWHMILQCCSLVRCQPAIIGKPATRPCTACVPGQFLGYQYLHAAWAEAAAHVPCTPSAQTPIMAMHYSTPYNATRSSPDNREVIMDS